MKISAGIIPWRRKNGRLQVLLGHLGGPYWQNKDEGAWTVFKGLVNENETPKQAALRELNEETGWPMPPELPWIYLGEFSRHGKSNRLWAVAWEPPLEKFHSNSFSMEWPPHSGRQKSFPEIDRVEWFDLETARKKIISSLRPALDALAAHVSEKH